MNVKLVNSKTKLQHINQDLLKLNQELKVKVTQVNKAHTDLKNMMGAMEIPMLFLDDNMCLKRFTPRITDVFNIVESDIGRPLSDLTHQFDYSNLIKDLQRACDENMVLEKELENLATKEWFMIRFNPFNAKDNHIRGMVIIFINITKRKIYEEELTKLNDNLEKQVQIRTNQVKQLASDVVIAEEKERKRIAQLLHNDLQQRLFAVQTGLKLINQDLGSDHSEDFDELVDHIEHALKLTCQLVADMSANLKENSLNKAIDWLANHMKELHELEVDLDTNKTIILKDHDQLLLLLQILRELLFNIVKHADTKKARILFEVTKDELRIHVIDKGKGFNPDEMQYFGFGLKQIEEQLKILEGYFLIDSSLGEGTDSCLYIPSKIFKESTKQPTQVASYNNH